MRENERTHTDKHRQTQTIKLALLVTNKKRMFSVHIKPINHFALYYSNSNNKIPSVRQTAARGKDYSYWGEACFRTSSQKGKLRKQPHMTVAETIYLPLWNGPFLGFSGILSPFLASWSKVNNMAFKVKHMVQGQSYCSRSRLTMDHTFAILLLSVEVQWGTDRRHSKWALSYRIQRDVCAKLPSVIINVSVLVFSPAVLSFIPSY